MTVTLLLLLKLSVVALILAIGMSSTISDLVYLWRRPGLLLRSLFAMYVAVPLIAFVVVAVVNLPPGVEIAILVLAVSAGAPLLPRKLMKVGQASYMFSLVITSSALAIVAVPVWLEILGSLYGITKHPDPMDVAIVIAKSFLGPLVIGMLIRWRFPKISERLAERILTFAGLLLLACAVLLMILHFDLLLTMGWPSMLTLAGMTLAALSTGHVLGGPAPDDRTGLAIACATRHVGVAVLVAGSFPGPKTAVLVTAYLLASALVSIPYLKWRQQMRMVAA